MSNNFEVFIPNHLLFVWERALDNLRIFAKKLVFYITPIMTKPNDDQVEKAEKEISSQRLELIQQIDALNNSAILSEADADGNITFINDLFCQISEYSREELIGQNHRLLKSGKQADGLFVGMWKTISLGKVWQGEIMNKKKHGGYYWVATTIVPFKDADGKIYKYVGIRFDITKQKEQQDLLKKQSDELRVQQEKLLVANAEFQEVSRELEKVNKLLEKKAVKAQISYQDLYESLRQDVFLINLDGIVVNVNRKGILNCGFDSKDILGNHYSKSPFLRKILGTETEAVFTKYFDNHEGKNEIVEFNGENQTGELFYGEADVCLSLIDGKFHLQVAISDVTEKKKSELAHMQSEERFELAMKGANDGLWDWNLLTDEVYYSPRWKGILGFEEEDLQSNLQTWKALLHEEDRERAVSVFHDYLHGKISDYQVEFRMKHKLGHYVNILSRGQGVRDSTGKFVRIVGTHLDVTERLKKLDTIRKSELRLNKAQKIGKIGDWERDLATGEVSWSEEMYNIYHCDSATFKPNVESILNLIHPDDKKLFSTWVAATISGKRVPQMDYRILVANGNIKFIRAGGEIIFDELGKPIKAYGTAQDITELKKTEVTLKKSEFMLSQAQRIAKIGSWEFDLVSLEHNWSSEMYKIYNCDPDSFIPASDSIINLLVPEDRNILRNRIAATTAGKREPAVIIRILNPDNSFKYIRGDSETIYDDAGKAIRAIGTSQDVTEIKKAEKEIIKQIKFTENILNNLPADIVVFDANHNYIFINPIAIKDVKIRKWLIGKNDFDYCALKGIDDSFAYRRRRFFEETIQNKEGAQWIDEQVTTSGKTEYKLRKFHPHFEKGKIEFVIGYGMNITELKESEIQLKKTVVELNNRYNEMMQFNYIVSHNLRAPVANILGLFNILNLPNTSQEEKNKSIQYMHSSILKMDELIKDLSVILATRSSLNTKKELVSIPLLIQSISSTLENELKDSGSTLELQIEEDAKELLTVKSYVESILYNMISNSIKYKSRNAKPQIVVVAKKENDQLALTVSDNGIGIDLNRYKDQLFGLYKRFNTEVEGKGLGLHMIKTQVETLGGSVAVESELGKGTSFVITLPLN